MKKILIAAILFVISAITALAQTQPNLLNGMAPGGSYDGSSVDTVNLMNGNLTLHIPLPVDVPQRGKLGIKYYLVVNAKNWQALYDTTYLANQWTPTWVCTTSSLAPPTSGPCGQGPVFVSTASFGITRGYTMTFTDGVGTDYYVDPPKNLDTWDGSSHGLVATATSGVYVAKDTSGYRVQVSGSNFNGLPYDVLITDRDGTQYQGAFHHDQNTCVTDSGGSLPGSTSTTTCTEHFVLSTVTDANGNVLTSTPFGIPTLDVPTWNGPTITATEAVGTQADGCYAVWGTPWVAYLNYLGPNGQPDQIKLCFAVYPQLFTSFSPTNIHQFQDVYGSRPFPGIYRQPIYLSDVILPDNTKWYISYDVYGEILGVGTPSGASIQYSWHEGQFPFLNGELTSVSRAVKARTVADANGQTFTWTYQWGSQASDGTVTHTVTGPNNNDTVHVFKSPNATTQPVNLKEIQTLDYQGTGASRTLLQQVDTTWLAGANVGLGVPTDRQTTLFPSNKVSLEHTDYDTGTVSFGLPISHKVYDWGQGAPGGLLRETDTVYLWQLDSGYATANLLNLPASTVTISPTAAENTKAGCPVSPGVTASCMAETDYTYDEPAYLTAYETTVGALPAGSHVAAPNPAPVRGNLTTVSNWLSSSSSFISSHTKWYDTGEPHISTDPLGHDTTIFYDLAYNGALPTMTCNAKNQCGSATYDVNTGLIASFTDPNASYQASGTTQGDPAHTTVYSYDFMRRLTSAVAPPDSHGQQPQTLFDYPNAITVHKQQAITGLFDNFTSHLDGLGHVTKTEHVTPDGTVLVDTVYDGLGHVTSVTNPYIGVPDGTIQTQYDGAGRPTTVIEQDGSVRTLDYSAGNCTTSFDEAGNQRKSCSDGLGRLTEVDEPNPDAPASSAAGWVTISGTEQTATTQQATPASVTVTIGGTENFNVETICTLSCHTLNIADAGTIEFTVVAAGVTVGPVSANYMGGSTPETLAAALYSAFPANSVVTMSDPNGTASFTLTTVASGSAANTSTISTQIASSCVEATDLSCSGPGWTMTLSGPNLAPTTASSANFTGGQDAGTTDDSGNVTVTLNGTPYATNFGTGDSAGLIAGRLASLISAGTIADATAAGNKVNITAKNAGPAGNSITLAASYTWDTAQFASPSFTTAPSGSMLSGGFNAGDVGNNPYVTLYQYDGLGNLLRVDQKGSAPSDSSQWRTRTFTYDSLSRLLTAHNPESGDITYQYDPDGNLLMKTSPAPNQTGAATQSISYCYDELNRLTKKDYQAHTFAPPACPITTPVVSFTYGQGTNGIGHITSLTDQAGGGSYSYDALGRMLTEQRTIAGISKSMSYDYNLDGSLKTLTYPSGAVITYAPWSNGTAIVGGPQSAVDGGNSINYATGADYAPDGAIKSFVSGQSAGFNGIANSFTYNKRLQPINMSAVSPTQTVFSIGYDFHVGNGTSGADNGNVFGITNFKDANRSQAFTYDTLNRLTSAQNAGANCALMTSNGKTAYWGNNYGYDAWGNLLQKSITKCGAENFSFVALANNQLSGYGYDAAGNMTNDLTSGLTYSYDPENRITGANGYAYTYDADGNRVEKLTLPPPATPTDGTLYWYMAPGIVAESDLTGALKSEYVFFNGERVARRDFGTPGGVFYYFSDHLKTASVITDSAGNIKSDSDYYPWGGELQFVANDPNHYKFTGKERDTETGLDYFGARYYSNGLGRFITPDWAAKAVAVPYAIFSDPQSLNLYSYARNVPTTTFDPDGHFADPFGTFSEGDTGMSNIQSRSTHSPGGAKKKGKTKKKKKSKKSKPASKSGTSSPKTPTGGGLVVNTPCEANCAQAIIQKLGELLGWGEVTLPTGAHNGLYDPPITLPVPKGFEWINAIANGHGYEEHAMAYGSRQDYGEAIKDLVEDAQENGDVRYRARDGATAYWAHDVIVIHNPNDPDHGSTFPADKDYFEKNFPDSPLPINPE